MRALDDLRNPVALDRETGQMDLVLGVDYGLCECGCGEETAVARVTDRSKRWVRGKPYRFKRGLATLGSKLAGPGGWGYVLNDFELGWVAGLIEGEGSFTIKKARGRNGFSCQPQLRVSMTDEDIIRELAYLVPVGNVLKAGRRTRGGKVVWMWTLTNSQALIV
jgi:hypothetical protein